MNVAAEMAGPQLSVLPTPTVSLLLSAYPLIRLLRGEKKDHFRRAWIACALQQASAFMGCEEGRLPVHPRAALLALHEAVLQLGEMHGITRRDFVEKFNEHAESGEFSKPEDADEAIRRCVALLSMLCARRLENAA